MPARIVMMAMTTNSSMRVNAIRDGGAKCDIVAPLILDFWFMIHSCILNSNGQRRNFSRGPGMVKPLLKTFLTRSHLGTPTARETAQSGARVCDPQQVAPEHACWSRR